MRFRKIDSVKRGDLYEMLVDSYKMLLNQFDPKNKELYLSSWRTTDDIAFDNPQTIGKCVIVSFFRYEPIGFISYDPRELPEKGTIGQNCVRSEYKGNGFGSIQLEHVLDLFSEEKCKKVFVSTGDNPFFIPAQKMYERAGFRETNRVFNKTYNYNEIILEKSL